MTAWIAYRFLIQPKIWLIYLRWLYDYLLYSTTNCLDPDNYPIHDISYYQIHPVEDTHTKTCRLELREKTPLIGPSFYWCERSVEKYDQSPVEPCWSSSQCQNGPLIPCHSAAWPMSRSFNSEMLIIYELSCREYASRRLLNPELREPPANSRKMM